MRILLYSKTDIYILENVSGLLPLSFDGNYLNDTYHPSAQPTVNKSSFK